MPQLSSWLTPAAAIGSSVKSPATRTATHELWLRLLGRPGSEYGRLCHGAGGPEGGGRCRRVLMLTTLFGKSSLHHSLLHCPEAYNNPYAKAHECARDLRVGLLMRPPLRRNWRGNRGHQIRGLRLPVHPRQHRLGWELQAVLLCGPPQAPARGQAELAEPLERQGHAGPAERARHRTGS